MAGKIKIEGDMTKLLALQLPTEIAPRILAITE